MSLPATLYPSLGSDIQGKNDAVRRQEMAGGLAWPNYRQARALSFNRGAQVQGSAMGAGLPYAASVRLLVQGGAVRGARELLKLALSLHPDDPELLRLHEVLAPPTVKKISAPDHDRDLEFRWLEEEGAHHRGFWVALDGATLLAEARTLKELLARLEPIASARRPLIHHIA